MIPLLIGVCTTTLCLPKVCDDSYVLRFLLLKPPLALWASVFMKLRFYCRRPRNGQFGLLQCLTGLASTVADKTLAQNSQYIGCKKLKMPRTDPLSPSRRHYREGSLPKLKGFFERSTWSSLSDIILNPGRRGPQQQSHPESDPDLSLLPLLLKGTATAPAPTPAHSPTPPCFTTTTATTTTCGFLLLPLRLLHYHCTLLRKPHKRKSRSSSSGSVSWFTARIQRTWNLRALGLRSCIQAPTPKLPFWALQVLGSLRIPGYSKPRKP